MRLLITETPERRHLSKPGQARVLAHDLGRIWRGNKKHVEREAARPTRWLKLALRSGEIKRSGRLVEEHRPTRRSDDPWNGDAASVRLQFVAALPADHPVHGAAAIKLSAPLSQAKQRGFSGFKENGAGIAINSELLESFTVLVFHRER